MSSSKEYLDFVLEQLSATDSVSYKSMMGEYIIYYKGKIIGGIYDDRFLVKNTVSARKLMPSAPTEIPYQAGKPMLLVEDIENKEFLRRLFEAMFDELPNSKRKQ